MHKTIIAALALLGVGLSNADAADPLTVVVFGRGNQEAMTTAYIDPFQKATGVKVNVLSYDGEMTEVLDMTTAGRTLWDVIQVETRALERGCSAGIFEKIDPAKITNLPDLIPGSVSECGVATFMWSQALAYNADRVKGTPPLSWADFWDLKRFPGKRGLRRSAKYTLEIALLADGVAPADVYKVLATNAGADRAFRKLDEIKADTMWWQAAQQPSLFLAADRVIMSSSYTLYIDRQRKRGTNLKLAWNGSIYDFDHWAVPKGAPHLGDAYRFIAFASRPENQKLFAEDLAYGPVNVKTLRLLDSKRAEALPTAPANLKGALAINIPFWIRYGPNLEARFAKWAPPLEEQDTEEHGPEVHSHGSDTAPHTH